MADAPGGAKKCLSIKSIKSAVADVTAEKPNLLIDFVEKEPLGDEVFYGHGYKKS